MSPLSLNRTESSKLARCTRNVIAKRPGRTENALASTGPGLDDRGSSEKRVCPWRAFINGEQSPLPSTPTVHGGVLDLGGVVVSAACPGCWWVIASVERNGLGHPAKHRSPRRQRHSRAHLACGTRRGHSVRESTVDGLHRL